MRIKRISVCILNKGYDYIRNIFTDSDSGLKADIISRLADKKADQFSNFFDRTRDNFNVEVRQKLAEFYGKIKTESAADWLEAELKSENRYPAEYRRELIGALGGCGNYKSISVLNGERKTRYSREIDKAIAEIQERIGAGDSGWLTLEKPEDEAGRLSIDKAEDEAGRLSMQKAGRGEGKITPGENEE